MWYPPETEDRWCNCIALHDFAGEHVRWQEWFDFVLAIFTKHNLPPTRLGVTGGYYGHSGKYLTFKGGYRKLQKYNFEKIENLGLVVTTIKDDYDTNFIIWTSLFPRWKNSKESYMTICIDEQLENFNIEKWQEFASKLQQFTKAKYGYYFHRHLRNQPYSYQTGVPAAYGINEEDAYYNYIWKYERFRYDRGVYIGGLYNTGKLRDIYRLNFLSREHLDWQIVEGQNLQSWINSKPNHGKLVQLNNDFWSWQVAEDQIANVKKQLNDSDIIICNQTRLEEIKKARPNLIEESVPYKRLLYPIEN